jgi:hypothetical protein
MHRVTPTRFDFASASRSSRVFAGMAEDMLERRIVAFLQPSSFAIPCGIL